MFLAANFEREFCRDWGAWLVDALFPRKHLTSTNQSLCLGSAFDETAFDEKNVRALSGRRGSGPPLGRLGFGIDTQRHHRRGNDIGACKTGHLDLFAGCILIHKPIRHYQRSEFQPNIEAALHREELRHLRREPTNGAFLDRHQHFVLGRKPAN